MIGRMKPPLFVRPLTDAERVALRAGLRSSDAFTLRRCQVLLASSEGLRPAQIAEKILSSLAPIVHDILARGAEDRTLVLYRRGEAGREERLSLKLDDLLGRGRDLTPGRRSLLVVLAPGAPRLDSRLKPHRELSEIRLEDLPTGQWRQNDPRDTLPVKLLKSTG